MHYVVSIPLDSSLAELIGKRGTDNGISFYNRKMDDNVIVGLAPSSIDERMYWAAQAMLISKQIAVSTAKIDRLFGEILVACSLIDRHVIFTDENDISAFMKGLQIRDYEFAPRGDVLARLLAYKPDYEPGKVRVDLDRIFPVKGIGTVALGIVTSGTVKVHDELYHSDGKRVLVRSIQAQDVDVESAPPGTRAGLALKGIEADEADKGDLLTSWSTQKTDSIRASLKILSAEKEDPKVGMGYELVSNFSYVRAVVENRNGNEATFKLAKKSSLVRDDEFLLMRDRAPRIFASGRVL